MNSQSDGDDHDEEVGGMGGLGVLPELKDIEPKGKKMQIWELLLDGIEEGDLSQEPYGFNKKTVGIVAWEMERAGVRSRPDKKGGKKRGTPIPVVSHGDEATMVTMQPSVVAKASTPEALVQSMTIPVEGQLISLEAGIKIGMSLVVIGVRVAQELSQVGVQQARPLVAMAKEMRAGESAAAAVASKETAYEMSNRMQDFLTPALNELGGMIEQGSKPKIDTGPNPMQGMMARMFEPLMQNMNGGLMPGGAPTSNAPSGWNRVTRTKLKED